MNNLKFLIIFKTQNNKKIFLDIFNNILDFNDSKVIIIFDSDGNIRFVLKDLLKILGYNIVIKISNGKNIKIYFTNGKRYY